MQVNLMSKNIWYCILIGTSTSPQPHSAPLTLTYLSFHPSTSRAFSRWRAQAVYPWSQVTLTTFKFKFIAPDKLRRQREITEPLAGAATNGSAAADEEATTGEQVSSWAAEKAKGQARKNKLVAAWNRCLLAAVELPAFWRASRVQRGTKQVNQVCMVTQVYWCVQTSWYTGIYTLHKIACASSSIYCYILACIVIPLPVHTSTCLYRISSIFIWCLL